MHVPITPDTLLRVLELAIVLVSVGMLYQKIVNRMGTVEKDIRETRNELHTLRLNLHTLYIALISKGVIDRDTKWIEGYQSFSLSGSNSGDS